MGNPKTLLKGNERGQGFKKGEPPPINTGRNAFEHEVRRVIVTKDRKEMQKLIHEMLKVGYGEDVEEVTTLDYGGGVVETRTKKYRKRDLHAIDILLDHGFSKPKTEVDLNHSAAPDFVKALETLIATEKQEREANKDANNA